MYCPKCGTEINDNSMFCPKCGKKIKTSIEKKENTTTSNINIDKLSAIIAIILIIIASVIPFASNTREIYSTFSYSIITFEHGTYIPFILFPLALFAVGKFTGRNRVVPIIGCIALWAVLVALAIYILSGTWVEGSIKYKMTLNVGFYIMIVAGVVEIVSIFFDKRRCGT